MNQVEIRLVLPDRLLDGKAGDVGFGGGISPKDDDHVGRFNILVVDERPEGSCRLGQWKGQIHQPPPRPGIDKVRAKGLANESLKQECVFERDTGREKAGHTTAPACDDPPQAVGNLGHDLLPFSWHEPLRFLEVDLVQPFLVLNIVESETSDDADRSFVWTQALLRGNPDDGFALRVDEHSTP